MANVKKENKENNNVFTLKMNTDKYGEGYKIEIVENDIDSLYSVDSKLSREEKTIMAYGKKNSDKIFNGEVGYIKIMNGFYVGLIKDELIAIVDKFKEDEIKKLENNIKFIKDLKIKCNKSLANYLNPKKK